MNFLYQNVTINTGILQLNKPIMRYRPNKACFFNVKFFYIIVFYGIFYKGMIYYIQEGFQHESYYIKIQKF